MKNHKKGLIAICDAEIIGKKLNNEEISIKIKKSFYGKKLVSKKIVQSALKNGRVLNLMGENVVNLAIDGGIIRKENTINIQNVPHAQILRI